MIDSLGRAQLESSLTAMRRAVSFCRSRRLELGDPLGLFPVGEGEERDLMLTAEQLPEHADQLAGVAVRSAMSRRCQLGHGAGRAAVFERVAYAVEGHRRRLGCCRR